MRAKWITIPLTLALFVLSLLAASPRAKTVLSASDRPELLVDLSLPQNASIFASEDGARRFDAALEGDADVARWSTYVGRGAIRFYLPLNAQLPNDFFAQAVIVAKDVAARERLQAKLEKFLQTIFQVLVARVYPLELGPPVGWPMQYRVSGPDIEEVRESRSSSPISIAANPSTERVNFDWIEPARQLRIRIDQDEARLLGLSSQSHRKRVEYRHSGQRRHPGPRRYLSCRRRCSRHGRTASLARRFAAAGAPAERADRIAQPVRNIRV